MTAFHQLLGVFLKHTHSLALDIGAHRAADIGTFVPLQTGFLQRLIDDLHGAFHLALLVGVLYPQQKASVVALGYQISEQRCPQVAHMHIACGAGGKTGPYMVKLEHNTSSFIFSSIS